jgi:hypothetical protein
MALIRSIMTHACPSYACVGETHLLKLHSFSLRSEKESVCKKLTSVIPGYLPVIVNH